MLLSFYAATAQGSKWGVSFTPSLIQSPSIRYGVQPGVEYRINDRLALLAEFAFPVGNSQDSSYGNSTYFRIKPELRYTFRKSRFGPDMYGGIQMSFVYRKWDDQNGGCYYEKDAVNTQMSYDKASISSPIVTSSLQFGIIYPLGKLHVDFFAGMGARMVLTNYSNVENSVGKPFNKAICKIIPVPDPAFWMNGTVARFHSNFGMRLLYRF